MGEGCNEQGNPCQRGRLNRHRSLSPLSCIVSRARLTAPLLLLTCAPFCSAQADSHPSATLPDAPSAQIATHTNSKGEPCKIVPKSENLGAALGTVSFQIGNSLLDAPLSSPQTISPEPGSHAALNPVPMSPATEAKLPPCPPASPPPFINWFARFITGPEVKALSPKEKARLAARNLLDPFNAVTILGNAAISIGADSHSDYGPGMPGFGRYVGVSYAEDMTGEFFGTFLIPSVVHQDPHYHRLPRASIPHRIGHAIWQVGWTQGDNGNGMLNYANIVGFAIDDEIANLYVPGRETNAKASASRYAIGLATAPIDNFITEFLPDVARRIHIRVVLVQRIINQVAKTDTTGGS